ncbi:Alkyltransferase-like protein 1 [Trichoderma lentiforme]|uniref:Alkyltransferase-like protein 1 n=1 Tax=Trichoderma lentiforme TaxID=1567552 RepID=A0A9P5CF59_9HYPO|nr:Alkyltransferase-like protein 1 [Trichoderma lentiforme]
MPRSNETEWWVNAVYETIMKIPYGRVTTYKHIAELLETHTDGSTCRAAQRARQVGTCLWNLSPAVDPSSNEQGASLYNLGNVPWQRVINSKGMISHRGGNWANVQAQMLRGEGVHVSTDEMGEHHINMSDFGWFPSSVSSDDEEFE